MNPVRAEQVKKFLALKPPAGNRPGESFFVEGAKRRDLEYLRQSIKRAGANIRIVEIEQDEIFGVPGVRCWRLAGECDEL